MTAPAVTVVIPTRDRVDALRRCLAALQPGDDPVLDVVVVDDGSDEPTAVAAVARQAGARLVRLEGRGPAAARNAGVLEARHGVVLFADDDCVPQPGWATSLAAAVAGGRGDVVGGLTVPAPGAPATVVASEVITRAAEQRMGFVAASNLAAKREVLLRQPFDERFRDAAGEDREWCSRLARLGLRIAREPAAVVWHAPAPGLASFWSRHRRYGRAAQRLAAANGRRLQGPGFYAGLVRAGAREGLTCGLLVAVAQLATLAGYVGEEAAQRVSGARGPVRP